MSSTARAACCARPDLVGMAQASDRASPLKGVAAAYSAWRSAASRLLASAAWVKAWLSRDTRSMP